MHLSHRSRPFSVGVSVSPVQNPCGLRLRESAQLVGRRALGVLSTARAHESTVVGSASLDAFGVAQESFATVGVADLEPRTVVFEAEEPVTGVDREHRHTGGRVNGFARFGNGEPERLDDTLARAAVGAILTGVVLILIPAIRTFVRAAARLNRALDDGLIFINRGVVRHSIR